MIVVKFVFNVVFTIEKGDHAIDFNGHSIRKTDNLVVLTHLIKEILCKGSERLSSLFITSTETL